MTSTQLSDSFVLDGVRRTSDGYLAAFARVARTGVQIYRGSELGRPDLDQVRVYRPPEEVFSADALRSFAHRPVTLRHPSVPVTSKNWKKFAGGQTGDEVVRDGDFVRVPMVMMDQALIDAYEHDGIKELSMGYSTDIKWRAGVTDSGEPYDAVQTAIRGNHLAVVPLARGGDQLRIGDGEEDIYDKDFSAEERKKAAESGAAMPDGSFPIENTSDLKNAVRLYGRASNPAAAKRHIVKRAKALGAESELPEDWKTTTNDEGEFNMKLVIDGVPVNVADDQSGAIIERHIASLTKQISDAMSDLENLKKKKNADEEQLEDAKKTISTKDGEIAVLKKQVEDAKVTPEKLDALVKDRLAVVDKARPMLDKSYSFDGKTVEQVRKDAVTAKLGDAVVKHMNDAAVEGAFSALAADTKTTNAATQIGDAIRSRPHSVTQVTDAAQKAHDEMTERLSNAWKTPSAA